jgi:CBS-domain-containing membrane protein
MIAADVMTRDVACVQADSALLDAVQLMVDRHVSGLPVLDPNGALVGMLTEADLLRRAETGTELRPSWLRALCFPGSVAESFVKTEGLRVSEVMRGNVASVPETASLNEIVTLMENRRIKRVPVLRGQAIVGIVSRGDLVKALGRLLQIRAAPLGDAAIAERLHATLAASVWSPQNVTLTVTDGRVQLYGTLFDERYRNAIRVAAENVPGVVSVADHLIYVEPNSGMTLSPDNIEPGDQAYDPGR